MNIEVRIHKVENEKDLRAYATVTIGGAYAAHGIRVVNGKSGLFVAMPSRKRTNAEGQEEFVETFHPVNKEAREAITEAVLKAYNAAE